MERLDDIPYGSHKDQVLDLMWQAGCSLPAPLIVAIHGGGWRTGSENEGYTLEVASELVERIGVAAVSVRYRLDVLFPSQVADIRMALDFLRMYPTLFDTEGFMLMGTSAGGHLAMMAAILGEKCRAVISFCGPTDLNRLDYVRSINPGLLASVFGADDPETLRTFSPIAHVGPGVRLPDHLLISGAFDKAVPIDSVCEFYQAMKRAGNTVFAVPVITPTGDAEVGHNPLAGICPDRADVMDKVVGFVVNRC